MLSLEDQREALLELLSDVEDKLSAPEKPAESPKSAAKPEEPKRLRLRSSIPGKAPPSPAAPVDESGPTALIIRTLLAAKQPMTSKEIFEVVKETKPDIELPTVLKSLHRLCKKRGSGLVRRGKPGDYRYTIKEVSAA